MLALVPAVCRRLPAPTIPCFVPPARATTMDFHLEIPGTEPGCSSRAWRGDFDHGPGIVPISGPKQGCNTSKGKKE